MVFYFHAVAGQAVAPFFFGVNPAGIPISSNVLELFVINGFTAVTMFFVLSGFVFTYGALNSPKADWKNFYVNRVLRIYPLFILVNLLALHFQSNHLPITKLLMNLVGIGNYGASYGKFDIVLWAIAVELQFYAIFPLLINLLKRKGVKYLIGLIGLMVAIRLGIKLHGSSLHDPVYLTLIGRLDQFLIGMVAAWYVNSRGWLSSETVKPKLKMALGLFASVVVLAGLLWLYMATGWKYGDSYWQVVWPTLEGLAWVAIGIYFVGLVRHRKIRWLKLFSWVGVVSYSIYVLHYPIIKTLQPRVAINWPAHHLLGGILSSSFIYFPASLLAAALAYNFIEKPALKLRKDYISKKSQKA